MKGRRLPSVALLATLSTVMTIALGAVGARADVTTYRYNVQRTGYTDQKVAPPLALLWKFSTEPDSGLSAQPLILGDRIIFCALGRVYALDAETGEEVWPSFDTAYNIRMTPVYHDGRLFVGNDNGEMYILDPSDTPAGQRQLAVLDLGAPISASPVIIDEYMYVVDDSGTLLRLNLNTYEPETLHQFRTGAKHQLTYDGDGLYFTGIADGIVYAWDLRRSRQRWAQAQGQLVTAPVAGEQYLFVGTAEGVKALRTRVGRPEWQSPPIMAAVGAPALTGDHLIMAGRDEVLYLLDRKTGQPVAGFELDGVMDVPATVIDDTVYVGTLAGNLYALDAGNLAVKWYYRLDPVKTVGGEESLIPVATPVVAANGYVVAVNKDGTLFCFKPDAVDVGKPQLYLPQITTRARDNSLVALPIYDDELREALAEEARLDAETLGTDAEEVELPEDAKLLALPGRQNVFRFETYVFDEGSGVDMERMVVLFDGQPYNSELMQITQRDNLLTVDLAPAPGSGLARAQLADGDHTLTVRVPDFKGNLLERNFTFHIDNTLPGIEPPPDQTQGGFPGGPGGPGGFPSPGGPGGPGGGSGGFPGPPGAFGADRLIDGLSGSWGLPQSWLTRLRERLR